MSSRENLQAQVSRRWAHARQAEVWKLRARCRDEDPELWFPQGENERSGSKRVRAWTMTAKAICAQCPVTGDCLTFAISLDLRYGIWGGLTEQERAKLDRETDRRMSGYYDRDGNPIGIEQFGRLLVDEAYHRIELVEHNGVRVSTVWLGIDHNYGDGPPVIFESMNVRRRSRRRRRAVLHRDRGAPRACRYGRAQYWHTADVSAIGHGDRSQLVRQAATRNA